VFAAALAVICVLPCAAKAAQFLSAEIDSALSERAEFLRRLDLADEGFHSIKSWAGSGDADAVRDRLGELRRSGGPWHHYISGFVSGADDRDAAERFFGMAVTAAGEDPGALWLLALEFIRNGETRFADDCLDAVEKYILSLAGPPPRCSPGSCCSSGTSKPPATRPPPNTATGRQNASTMPSAGGYMGKGSSAFPKI